jgi:hypothetical protein
MADLTTYTEYHTGKAPVWLRGERGDGWWQLWGNLKDAVLAGVKQAVRQRYPADASAGALEIIGNDRSLERMPGELPAVYAARLEAAFDTWERGGTRDGVRDAVVLTGLMTPVYDGDEMISPRVVEAWEWDPDSPLWARFWVVITQPHVFKAPRKYGDGGLYGLPPTGDGALYGFTGATRNQAALLRRQVAKWKGGHNRCVEIIIVISGTIYGGGHAYGDGTTYGTKTARLPAP